MMKSIQKAVTFTVIGAVFVSGVIALAIWWVGGSSEVAQADDPDGVIVGIDMDPYSPETGTQCENDIDDDGDTNINDGCPTVGSLPEDPSCVNDADDDAGDDDGSPTVNDGCPQKDGYDDCDLNEDGDCADPGPPDETTLCDNALDDDGDTRVNDGCPTVGSNPEDPACANDIDDDAGDDGGTSTVNDGCPAKGNSCPQNQTCVTEGCPEAVDCTLGAIDTCISVTAGDSVEFDVFLDDLDVDGHLGHGYKIGGWPASGTDGTPPQITAAIHCAAPALTTSRAGTSCTDGFGEDLPDGDSPLSVTVTDMKNAEYNPPWTKGVLGRYTLDTTNAAPGVYGLTLTSVVIGRDTMADALYPGYPLGGSLTIAAVLDANHTPLPYGILAVGVPCPSYADVEIVSQEVQGSDCSSDPPISMDVGVDKVVCLRKSIVNNGPTTPVDVDITTTLSQVGGIDCTITPDPYTTSETGLVKDSPVTVDELFTINCTEPCAHSFSFQNDIDVTTADVIDQDETNNSATTPYSADVLAEADLQASTVTVTTDPTPEAAVGELIDVTVSVDVINNGPWGPVNGDVTFDLTVPDDCSPTPTQQTVEDQTLPVATTAVSYTWMNISCTSTGPHSLDGGATVALDDPTGHTTDDVTGNEDSTGSGSITITSAADVQVLSWTFPDDMPAIPGYQVRVVPGTGVDRTIDSTEVLHNDGPYTPVHVDVVKTVSDADMDGGGVDCDIEPNSPATWQPTLPDSTNVQDVEQFDIDWVDDPKPPYSCTFTFNKTLTITDADVGDPTPESPTRDVEAIRDTDGDTVVDRYATGDEDGAGLGSCNDGLDNGPDGDTDVDDADCTLQEEDNCQDDVNPGQEDVDEDGIGDVCDPDNDNDTVLDVNDNCPLIPNPDQEDEEGDGIGDVCELDVTCDGVLDPGDVVMLLRYLVGLATLSDDCPPPPGSLNGPRATAYDDGINIGDVVAALQCIAGPPFGNIVCPVLEP